MTAATYRRRHFNPSEVREPRRRRIPASLRRADSRPALPSLTPDGPPGDIQHLAEQRQRLLRMIRQTAHDTGLTPAAALDDIRRTLTAWQELWTPRQTADEPRSANPAIQALLNALETAERLLFGDRWFYSGRVPRPFIQGRPEGSLGNTVRFDGVVLQERDSSGVWRVIRTVVAAPDRR